VETWLKIITKQEGLRRRIRAQCLNLICVEPRSRALIDIRDYNDNGIPYLACGTQSRPLLFNMSTRTETLSKHDLPAAVAQWCSAKQYLIGNARRG
jgi:hypothetical protein